LPKNILHPWLDELIAVSHGAMQSMLVQLKLRPTFQEQWPNEWQTGLSHGKFRTLEVEKIRKDVYTLIDILSLRPEVLEWYDAISESYPT